MKKQIYFEDIDFSSEVFDKVSVKLIKELTLIPYKETNDSVFILKTEDSKIINDNVLKLIFNKPLIYQIISLDDFNKVVDYLSKSSLQDFYENILNQTSNIPLKNQVVLEEKEEFYDSNIKNSLVVRTIDNIIEKGILLKASDIHFEPTNDLVIVRMRIDGELKKHNEYSHELYSQITSRIKVLCNLDITKHLLAQDGKFMYKYNNDSYDIRTSILPTLYGERISLRILDSHSNDFSLDDLYLDEKSKINIEKILNDQNGLILVVGPTGSGKTTTLYSMLKKKINEKVNIITVEDPIEYSVEGISQVQVNNDLGLTFNETLRTVLRQDPDIFMIGEIRDEESAEIAIRSATTGHLVFSTLHANDAQTAISRLLDMNIGPFLIASSTRAIIYQKLFKKRCSKCQKEVIINKKVEVINEGCNACNYTGYSGRIAIGEMLFIDDELRKSIINNTFNEKLSEYIKDKKFIKIDTNIKKAKKENLIN